MNFPCSGCGLCCKVIPKMIEGWPLREDGACYFLTDDNRCDIYETRPNVCRVRGMKPEGKGLMEHYRETAEECNRLIAEHGLDERWLVKIES